MARPFLPSFQCRGTATAPLNFFPGKGRCTIPIQSFILRKWPCHRPKQSFPLRAIQPIFSGCSHSPIKSFLLVRGLYHWPIQPSFTAKWPCHCPSNPFFLGKGPCHSHVEAFLPGQRLCQCHICNYLLPVITHCLGLKSAVLRTVIQ